MTRKVDKDDSLLKELEAGVSDILKNKKTKVAERLKAIEAGAKLLAIRHRIEGGPDGGDDAEFFNRR